MKVVHISRFDGGGGAAMAANRLHQSLQRLGIDSTMFVAEKFTDDPTVTVFQLSSNVLNRVRRRLQRERIKLSWLRYRSRSTPGFSDDRVPGGADLLAQLPAGDIINIHVAFGFLDYRTFFAAVPQHTPVVRTLHDMNFFTGGCHYAWNCGKYRERCGACPQLGSRKEEDMSRQIWRRKRAALSTIPPNGLHLVAPSSWVAKQAKQSSLLQNFPVTTIPLAVDTEIFRPRKRSVVRDALGIPQEASVVLFVAGLISEPLKGFNLLAQALNGVGDLRNLLLICVGRGQPRVEVRVPFLHLGQINNERLLSLVYSAADVFVIPSLQETFGQTTLEAIACGIPVIGSAVAGILDTVRPGVTGLLVPAQDIIALRAAIRDLPAYRSRGVCPGSTGEALC